MIRFLFLTSLIAATVSHNTFCQFYHIYLYEIMTNKVPNREAFMRKLSVKLKSPPSGEVHWRNAQKRFIIILPYLKQTLHQSYEESMPDNTTSPVSFLPSQVKEYVVLSNKAFITDPSASAVLFDDAHFYWSALKMEAGEDYEKRSVLLELLTLLRNLGTLFINDELEIDWVKYYLDNSFLRELANFNVTLTSTFTPFSNNEQFNEELRLILSSNQEPSISLQKRLVKYDEFRKTIFTYLMNSDNLSDLEFSEMHSHLGPLQVYFPGFMRERPKSVSRALLSLSLSKRYLEATSKIRNFPTVVLNNAVSAFSQLCNVYLHSWESLPTSKASDLLI